MDSINDGRDMIQSLDIDSQHPKTNTETQVEIDCLRRNVTSADSKMMISSIASTFQGIGGILGSEFHIGMESFSLVSTSKREIIIYYDRRLIIINRLLQNSMKSMVSVETSSTISRTKIILEN